MEEDVSIPLICSEVLSNERIESLRFTTTINRTTQSSLDLARSSKETPISGRSEIEEAEIFWIHRRLRSVSMHYIFIGIFSLNRFVSIIYQNELQQTFIRNFSFFRTRCFFALSNAR